jgi:hypothetical protein
MPQHMTVTDPDVPDPLNDPRTLQADPGAYGEGADLASAEDDATATGEEELADDQLADERDLASGWDPPAPTGGGDVPDGASSEAPDA